MSLTAQVLVVVAVCFMFAAGIVWTVSYCFAHASIKYLFEQYSKWRKDRDKMELERDSQGQSGDYVWCTLTLLSVGLVAIMASLVVGGLYALHWWRYGNPRRENL